MNPPSGFQQNAQLMKSPSSNNHATQSHQQQQPQITQQQQTLNNQNQQPIQFQPHVLASPNLNSSRGMFNKLTSPNATSTSQSVNTEHDYQNTTTPNNANGTNVHRFNSGYNQTGKPVVDNSHQLGVKNPYGHPNQTQPSHSAAPSQPLVQGAVPNNVVPASNPFMVTSNVKLTGAPTAPNVNGANNLVPTIQKHQYNSNLSTNN